VSRAMRTLAILPVKSFPNAKQRLSPGLDAPVRRQLAEAMLDDVLVALSATSVDEVIVVTAGEQPGALARRRGARVISDREQGHNEAAQLGVEEALRASADRVIMVPGDCPALDPSELDALLARPTAERSLIIVPDRHGTGTNALVIKPPDAVGPAFGPGSCERHARLARAAGIPHAVVNVPSLALDIDTPDDLAALEDLPERHLRTHDLLSRC
jgi:2-phospho-L-lactate/phosphoenolpyruvate guanylyltransferase